MNMTGTRPRAKVHSQMATTSIDTCGSLFRLKRCKKKKKGTMNLTGTRPRAEVHSQMATQSIDICGSLFRLKTSKKKKKGQH
jgi:hypothetical protein